MLSSKSNKSFSEKTAKNECFCFNEIRRLMIMKIRLKMKKKAHRYDINRPRPRNRHKFTKYKMYISIMMVVIGIKQLLSNI